MACLKGLEPPTYWFVASHSIQLSYRHIVSTNDIIPQIILFVKGFFKKSSGNFTVQKNPPAQRQGDTVLVSPRQAPEQHSRRHRGGKPH